MYHCSTMPMSAHIAAGMFGAVVIDPPDLPRRRPRVRPRAVRGLPRAGRGSRRSRRSTRTKVAAERPDAVVFNGVANQYDRRPLTAKVGERVRIWVLVAGPNRPTAFHVVGGQFDTTYAEGRYLLRAGPGGPDAPGGSQVLGLDPAQGGFVELSFPEAGHYPVVSHLMVDAERGAHGIVAVQP
jgi:nitrite reductase (NO-forming)